jgi:hypothetical protein
MHVAEETEQSNYKAMPETRVARFFLVQDTKTGKNVPNEHKMLQMIIKYTK